MPQAAGLAMWPSEDTVDSGLEAMAPMAEGCPYPVVIPGELVCLSFESGRGLAVQRVRVLVRKRNHKFVRCRASLFLLEPLQPSLAEPPVWLLTGPA